MTRCGSDFPALAIRRITEKNQPFSDRLLVGARRDHVSPRREPGPPRSVGTCPASGEFWSGVRPRLRPRLRSPDWIRCGADRPRVSLKWTLNAVQLPCGTHKYIPRGSARCSSDGCVCVNVCAVNLLTSTRVGDLDGRGQLCGRHAMLGVCSARFRLKYSPTAPVLCFKSHTTSGARPPASKHLGHCFLLRPALSCRS